MTCAIWPPPWNHAEFAFLTASSASETFRDCRATRCRIRLLPFEPLWTGTVLKAAASAQLFFAHYPSTDQRRQQCEFTTVNVFASNPLCDRVE